MAKLKSKKITKTEQRHIDSLPSHIRMFGSDVHKSLQEYRAKYGGRGKYKRDLSQYFIEVFDKAGKQLHSFIVWGWKGVRDERKKIHSDFKHQHKAYRLKILNGTKNKWVKK